MASAGSGEPSTAPIPDRWYTLRLGSSFNDDRPSSKFFTLRYEFQPASIDKSQPGLLHKSKESKISVEFQNNQPGKPKVTFEGTSEECRDNDGILFFDGHNFRLERLHRAVKRLRHVRQPGESAGASSSAPAAVISASSTPLGTESRSPPLSKASKSVPLSKSLVHPLPLEVEKIDIGESDAPAPKTFEKSTPPNRADREEDVDLSEDEIADVDLSDDDRQAGPNAAEVLRAQTIGSGSGGGASAVSSSSGSSGSGSSDSDSDDNSSSSAADEEIDIDGDI